MKADFVRSVVLTGAFVVLVLIVDKDSQFDGWDYLEFVIVFELILFFLLLLGSFLAKYVLRDKK